MDSNLSKLIKNAKNHDEKAMLEIIKRFQLLIKKYAKQLKYEEAESDLIISLIEIIKCINLNSLNSSNEGVIVTYILRSLNNRKIDLFRKYVKNKQEETELNLDILGVEFNNTIENNLIIESIFKTLTEVQKKVIKRKYIYGYSNVEIAEELNISRQAVNQTKNRALEKIKKLFF